MINSKPEKSIALGLWARHYEAMDYLYKEWFEEEADEDIPESLSKFISDPQSTAQLEKIFREADRDQRDLMSRVKDAVVARLNSSKIVIGPQRHRRADWDCSVKVSSKKGTQEVAYIYMGLESPIELDGHERSADKFRLVVSIWSRKFKSNDTSFLKLFPKSTFSQASQGSQTFEGWSNGTVVLFSAKVIDYMDERRSVDVDRLFRDTALVIDKLSDDVWTRVCAY